jgi:hypothetical protein
MKISRNRSAPHSTCRKASGGVLFWGETPMSFPGHIEKGMVVLDELLPLPDGTPVRVEPITHPPADFWESCSLDELAKRQGVSMPGVVADLFGGWPTDELNDGFEEAFLRWRERELEQRP